MPTTEKTCGRYTLAETPFLATLERELLDQRSFRHDFKPV